VHQINKFESFQLGRARTKVRLQQKSKASAKKQGLSQEEQKETPGGGDTQ